MADAWSPVGGDVDLYEELDLACTSGFILLTIVIRWECVVHTVQNVIPSASEYREPLASPAQAWHFGAHCLCIGAPVNWALCRKEERKPSLEVTYCKLRTCSLPFGSH